MLQFYADFLNRLEDLHRDIEKCIDRMPPEGLDWSPGDEMNSMAVLVVHTLGAERYWIGDMSGQPSSGRDRDSEFRAADTDEAALKQAITDADAYAKSVLEKLTMEDLPVAQVSPRNQREFTVGWSLLHALEHTALHLGHLQILRQLWDHRNTQ